MNDKDLFENLETAIMKTSNELDADEIASVNAFTQKYSNYLNELNTNGYVENNEEYSKLNNFYLKIVEKNENPHTQTDITFYIVNIIEKIMEKAINADFVRRRTHKFQNSQNNYSSKGYVTIALVLSLTILFGFILGSILWNIK